MRTEQNEPLLPQGKREGQIVKAFCVSFALFGVVTMATIPYHATEIDEIDVGQFQDPLKWRDVGMVTPLPGCDKSVYLTRADRDTLGQWFPIQWPGVGAQFTAQTLFGPNDSPQQPNFVVPWTANRAPHLDFPKVCVNGNIVATNAGLTSCSVVVVDLDANNWRAYHDEGYVVDYDPQTLQYQRLANGRGFVDFPNAQLATAAWPNNLNFMPVRDDPQGNPPNALAYNEALSWVYYQHYTNDPQGNMMNPVTRNQAWFWALRCQNQQWVRVIYHFTWENNAAHQQE